MARKLIRTSAQKVATNAASQRSLEIREEINKLINDLVEVEYKEADKGILEQPKMHKLPSDDEFLGMSKFSKPHFIMPNKRDETQRFIDRIRDEVEQELFSSKLFQKDQEDQEPEPEPNNNNIENSCKCLEEFYSEYSQCP